MGADIEDAALAAAGFDSALESAVVTAAPVLEVAKGKLAVQLEWPIGANSMFYRIDNAKAAVEVPVDATQRKPVPFKGLEWPVSQLAQTRDYAHAGV